MSPPAPPKFRITRAQIVLLALLGALAVASLLRGRRDENARERSTVAQTAFDAAAVRTIRFERGDARALVQKDGDRYRLVEPYRDLADERFLTQSLRVASTIQPIRTLPETASVAFGLVPPRARWSCTWEGGSFAIELGDSLPAGGGRYARLGSDRRVQILDAFLSRRFLAPPFSELHDPRAAATQVGPIDSVLIRTREETILAVRTASGSWSITRPILAEASAPRLGRALQALVNDELRDFRAIEDTLDLAPLGLDPPRAVWTLYQSGRGSSVRIGHPTADQRSVNVIPGEREVLAHIDSESFRDWVDGLARLREGSLFAVAPDSVVTVVAREGGRTRTLELGRDALWRSVAPGDTLLLDQQAVQIALGNLCLLQAARFLRAEDAAALAAAKGPGAGGLTVRLVTLAGRVDSVLFGPRYEGLETARARRQPGIALVPETATASWRLWLDRPPTSSTGARPN